MTGQANAFGQVLGGPAVGWIGTAFSLRAAIVSAGLLVAPISALYARARNYIQGSDSQAAKPSGTGEAVVGVTAEAGKE
jgi:hypothetical protein